MVNLFLWMWWDYLYFYMGCILLVLFFLIFEGLMLGLLSWMLKLLFDWVFVGGDVGVIWWVGGVIFGLFLMWVVIFVINCSLMILVLLVVLMIM